MKLKKKRNKQTKKEIKIYKNEIQIRCLSQV